MFLSLSHIKTLGSSGQRERPNIYGRPGLSWKLACKTLSLAPTLLSRLILCPPSCPHCIPLHRPWGTPREMGLGCGIDKRREAATQVQGCKTKRPECARLCTRRPLSRMPLLLCVQMQPTELLRCSLVSPVLEHCPSALRLAQTAFSSPLFPCAKPHPGGTGHAHGSVCFPRGLPAGWGGFLGHRLYQPWESLPLPGKVPCTIHSCL